MEEFSWFEARTQNNWIQVWNNLNGGNCLRKLKKPDKNEIFIYGMLILKQRPETPKSDPTSRTGNNENSK